MPHDQQHGAGDACLTLRLRQSAYPGRSGRLLALIGSATFAVYLQRDQSARYRIDPSKGRDVDAALSSAFAELIRSDAP